MLDGAVPLVSTATNSATHSGTWAVSLPAGSCTPPQPPPPPPPPPPPLSAVISRYQPLRCCGCGVNANSLHRQSQNHRHFSTDCLDNLPRLEVVNGVQGIYQ